MKKYRRMVVKIRWGEEKGDFFTLLLSKRGGKTFTIPDVESVWEKYKGKEEKYSAGEFFEINGFNVEYPERDGYAINNWDIELEWL